MHNEKNYIVNCNKWLIVCGAFVSYFVADGCTYSVGILFTEFKKVFQHNAAATSIFSAFVFSIPQLMSPIICPLVEVVGISAASAWGALFLSMSFIVTSLALSINIIYVSFGILTTIGLQLTYSSALMAVVYTFKEHKHFGLACGIAVCGGGLGAFSTNHILSYTLSIWTWREAMIIQAGIFLHVWCSAALFYAIDESQEYENGVQKLKLEEEDTNLIEQGDIISTCSEIITSEEVMSTSKRPKLKKILDNIKKIICYCPILMILTPSHHRPRVNSIETSKVSQCLRKRSKLFAKRLGSSLKQLLSRKVWKNTHFLFFTITFAISSFGVVIVWTFAFDYIRGMWIKGLNGALDAEAESQLAWFPSLIGLGTCLGQILCGLVASKSCQNCVPFIQNNNYSIMLCFVFVFNGIATAAFTLTPAPIAMDYFDGRTKTVNLHIFSTNQGCLLAFLCFVLGISDGAYMTLFGVLLGYLLDEKRFSAGLGIALCTNGIMNLMGPITGGLIFDKYGSYTPAFLISACLPIIACIIYVSFCLSTRVREPHQTETNTEHSQTTISRV